jgi:hypothetical protein
MPTPPEPGWSSDRLEHLRRRWLEDAASAGVIGRELGLSRSAVVSQVFRHGWQRRGAAGQAASGPRETLRPPAARPRPARTDRRRAPKPRVVPVVALIFAGEDICMGRDLPADAAPVAFVARPGDRCAWPIEPLEAAADAHMLCCGAPASKGQPYCAAHAARARRETPPLQPLEAALIRRYAS